MREADNEFCSAPECGNAIPVRRSGRGRARRYCCTACRVFAHRTREFNQPKLWPDGKEKVKSGIAPNPTRRRGKHYRNNSATAETELKAQHSRKGWAQALTATGISAGSTAHEITVLYARRDSIYHDAKGVIVYDGRSERYKVNPTGLWAETPTIAHPPCALDSRLRHLANRPASEKECALHALDTIRARGGVLEHPAMSELWKRAKEKPPMPGDEPDKWGGRTIALAQVEWGHCCRKWTWIYAVGCDPRWLARMTPFPGRQPTHSIGQFTEKKLKRATKREAEATPPALARALVNLCRQVPAQRCGVCGIRLWDKAGNLGWRDENALCPVLSEKTLEYNCPRKSLRPHKT